MPISITFTDKLGDALRASSLHVCHARRGPDLANARWQVTRVAYYVPRLLLLATHLLKYFCWPAGLAAGFPTCCEGNARAVAA